MAEGEGGDLNGNGNVVDRRQEGQFREQLSKWMMIVAALGGAYVLLDPQVTFTFWNQTVKIGGEGFSADLKGAVVSLILIGGFTSVKEYWLGASATGQKQAESMSRIAEASAPAVVAAAVKPEEPKT